MNRILIGILVPLAIGTSGCYGAYVACDDDDCEYVEAPVQVEVYPHFVYRGVVVYDVHGRYYRRLGDRWVVYRVAPGHRVIGGHGRHGRHHHRGHD